MSYLLIVAVLRGIFNGWVHSPWLQFVSFFWGGGGSQCNSIYNLAVVTVLSEQYLSLPQPAEPLLHSVVGKDAVGVRDDPRMQYYIKVMRLFEQVSAPDMVINVATEASKLGDPECPSTVRPSHP